MPRFFGRALALWIVLVVALSTAIAIGHQQPADKSLAQLHLTDCKLPCWIGITPGTTTLNEAREAMTRVYGRANDVRIDDGSRDLGFVYVDVVGPGGLGGEGYLSVILMVDPKESHIINTIDFRDSDLPPIADLFSVLGPPSQLRLPDVAGDAPVFFLSYGADQYNAMIGIRSDESDNLDWYAHAEFLTITAAPYHPINECPREQLRPWRGFRKAESYLENLVDLC